MAQVVLTDPITQVRNLMEQTLAQHPPGYTNSVLAQELIDQLRRGNPRLLEAYLHARATYLVTLELGQLNRADRIYRQQNASRSAFAEAAKTYEETGDTALLLAARFAVDNKGTFRLAADMTGKEHQFVADQKRVSAKNLAFQSRFHAAVAKRIGNKTTSEVFTERAYRELYQEFARRAEEKIA